MILIYLFGMCILSIGSVCSSDNTATVMLKTSLGQIKGVKLTNSETGEDLYEFRGIRFAKPPIGTLRFSKPEPFGQWKDTLDATSFGASCLQNVPEFMSESMKPSTSEDCLFLNIYIPKTINETKQVPVMVWIHGGGFEVGYGHEEDLSRMAMEGDVIMVSFNYRLGAFGFLALDHPAMRGNYALWDQKLALQWVHENIKGFGGDPNSVTIFGESAGGYSVSLMSLIPSNRGLFKRVIAQSGVHSKVLMRTSEEIREYASHLSEVTSCALTDEYKFVDCLRELPVETLLEVNDFYASLSPEQFKNKIFFKSYSYPVVDGELYPENPILGLEDKNSDVSKFFGSLDFMAGTTSNEGCLLYIIMFPEMQEYYGFNVTEGIPHNVMCEAVISPYVQTFLKNNPDIKRKMCKFYKANEGLEEQSIKATHLLADIMFTYPFVKMLEYHVGSKGKTYQYQFSRPSHDPFGGPPPSWYEGSCHGDELMWFFRLSEFKLTDEEKDFSKKLIQYWTSFAKTGRPNGGDGTPFWIPYDFKGRIYLDFDIPITLKSFLKQETTAFWSDIFKQVDISGQQRKRDEL